MNLNKETWPTFYFNPVSARLLFSALALLVFLLPPPVQAFEVLLGTGEHGSFSNFAGRALCRTISRHVPEVTCSTRTANDEIDNLTNLQSGSLDFAIINSNTLDDAVNKRRIFQFLDINYENLAILMPLYDRPIGLIARNDSGISTLGDLKGKRINSGPPGSTENRAMRLIMSAKGWSEDDFSLFEELPSSHSQGTMAFCHGTIQAMLTIGVHPALATQRVLENCNAHLVSISDDSIDKLVASRPPCWKSEIQAQSYPGHGEAVETFGTRAILVASNTVDQETANAIVKAIYDNRKRLQNSHPALSLYPVQEAGKGIKGLKLHEGAVRFFTSQ
ncbi:MAG: TAXI family TRAP transporter solute-binding subunit [Thermodesulfobacteriota bacterium]